MSRKGRKPKVPQQSKGDLAHSIVKAGLSSIPLVGGAVVEIFQHVIQPPLEKRRAEWMAEIGSKLQELEEKGLDLNSLKENEQFVSAVMHASQLALRTHQKEKLEALRNAIAKVALNQAPEETLQHIFLNLIDSLTVLHIQILKAFQAPKPPENMSMGGLSSVLEHNFPDLRGRRDLYDQLWKDLYSRGLVVSEGLHVTMSGSGLTQKQTSNMGDNFLNFIADAQV